MEVNIRHSHFLFETICKMMCEVNKKRVLTRNILYGHKSKRLDSEVAILLAVYVTFINWGMIKGDGISKN